MIDLTREFSSAKAFEKRPKAKYLAAFCSDPNYRVHFEELMDQLEEFRVDRIVEPGGPLVFLLDWEKPETFEESEVARLRLLLEHHQVEDVVLIGHAGCAAYKARYAGQNLAAEQLDNICKNDLLQLQGKFLEKFPNVRVHVLFAYPDAGPGGDVKIAPLPA